MTFKRPYSAGLAALAVGLFAATAAYAEPTVNKGDNAWMLVCAALLECLSFISYVILFRGVFAGTVALGWRQSYLITMAGVAATRLLAAGFLLRGADWVLPFLMGAAAAASPSSWKPSSKANWRVSWRASSTRCGPGTPGWTSNWNGSEISWTR